MLDRRLTLGTLIPLAAASIVANGFVLGRFLLSGQRAYGFLMWNLLLAWVPIGCALVAQRLAASLLQPGRPMRLRLQLVGLAAFSLGWLLFFPNAPYLMTDLVHLRPFAENNLLWYDLAMFAAFALIGVALGCLSLLAMQEVVATACRRFFERVRGARPIARVLAAVTGWVFALSTLAAGSYGMYLGRVMRWNSWDALLNPDDLALSILRSVIDRPSAPGMFKITAVFGLFLLCAYATLYAFTRVRRTA